MYVYAWKHSSYVIPQSGEGSGHLTSAFYGVEDLANVGKLWRSTRSFRSFRLRLTSQTGRSDKWPRSVLRRLQLTEWSDVGVGSLAKGNVIDLRKISTGRLARRLCFFLV